LSKTNLFSNFYTLSQVSQYYKKVLSGDPYIINNNIEKNYGNGISSLTFDNLNCDGKIRNNFILGNMENGI
jgi:hypothetical protein